MNPSSGPVPLPPLTGLQSAAWTALMELAPDLGTDWTLIGGQMVFLHQAERHSGAALSMRPTTDLDVVVNLRARSGGTDHIHRVLTDHGFVQLLQPIMHRYVRASDSVTFDVLAPDHLGGHLPRLGGGRTTQAPGSTQALRRTEWITVSHAGREAPIPRPNLIGALIAKQAAVRDAAGGRVPQRHRDDVHVLAGLLRQSDVATADLSRNERRLLRSAFDDLAALGTPHAMAAAARLGEVLDLPQGQERRPTSSN